MSDWLLDLKPGNLVVRTTGLSGDEWVLDHVARTTKTQVVLHSGGKYRKRDGVLVGTTCFRFRLRQTTEENLLRAQRCRVKRVARRALESLRKDVSKLTESEAKLLEELAKKVSEQ